MGRVPPPPHLLISSASSTLTACLLHQQGLLLLLSDIPRSAFPLEHRALTQHSPAQSAQTSATLSSFSCRFWKIGCCSHKSNFLMKKSSSHHSAWVKHPGSSFFWGSGWRYGSEYRPCAGFQSQEGHAEDTGRANFRTSGGAAARNSLVLGSVPLFQTNCWHPVLGSPVLSTVAPAPFPTVAAADSPVASSGPRISSMCQCTQ